jgi:hypothetical protein
MAQKRMFDKRVIDTDKFADLPNTSKALYFMAGIEADDRGFFQPRRLQKEYGFTDDDYKILIAKRYFICFESGVMVITDWNKNNWLDTRRITETEYIDELNLLKLVNNKYELNTTDKPCLADAKPMLSQYSIEENSIEENSIVQNSILESKSSTKTKKFIPPTLDEIKEYCIKRNNNIDPKVFYDYYNTGNWIDAKGNKVKNWKQKIITWERQSPKQRKDNSGWDYIDEEINAIRQDWVEAKCNETK